MGTEVDYISEGNPNSPDSVRLTDIVQTFNTNNGVQFPTRWSNIATLIRPEVLPVWGEITGDITDQTDLIEYGAVHYQPLNPNLTSWSDVTRADGFDTFSTTPSSANLRSLVSDETGTGSLVFSDSPSLTGTPTAPTQTPSNNSTKIATTAYVDAAILGQNYKEAVKYATIAALPAIIYSNGASGVGATLTGVAFGALGVDSASPAVNDRILVKNQVSTFQNGWYKVTATGSGIAVFVLTRTTDANQSFEFATGDTSFVTSGTALGTTTWAYTGIDNPVIGTDAITFAQTAGQGSFTAGNGIAITGVSVSIDTSITVDKTTSQTLTNKTLTTPIISNTAATTTAGSVTYDGSCFYGNTSLSKIGLIPVKYIMRQHAAFTLSNSGSIQQLFNGTTNGRITLAVGTYKFTCHLYMTSMSATSGNSAFSFVAGTATITNFLMTTIGLDSAPLTATAANYNGQVAVTNSFTSNMQVAGTGTAQISLIQGAFEVSVAGTVTPSIQLVNAAAAIVNIGSYIEIESWGLNTMTSVGAWD